MSSQTTSSQPKRPAITSRHSSGSIYGGRTSSTNLSSSLQKAKGQRPHYVAHPRMGPRIPSHSKNVNKMGKLLGHAAEGPSSPRLGHHSRNSSTQQLAQNTSHTDLKKNHSDTSLRKNRSSGQLMKLTENTVNKSKASKQDSKAKRLSRELAKPTAGVANPTVRFDLGDEDDDAWTDSASHSASQSPRSTRNHTRQNSVSYEQSGSKPSTLSQDHKPPPSITSNPNSTDPRKDEPSKDYDDRPPADSGNVAARLTNRNVSFNTAPRVSNISANAANASLKDATSPGESDSSQHGTMRSDEDSSQPMVSRFLNANGSASTPGDSSFVSQHQFPAESSTSDERVRRNRSAPNFSNSEQEGLFTTATPGAVPSRTQQKLWLERDSSNIEEQKLHPMHFYRSGRYPGSTIAYPTNSDSLAGTHFEQMLEQTETEYSRVRMYQNPLAQAIVRMQDAGIAPKTKLVSRPKPRNSLLNGAGDGAFGLSQSVRSQKSGKESSFESRRTKVSFSGAKGSKDDGELERTQTGSQLAREDDEASESRRQANDICRRLWQYQDGSGGE